MGESVNGFAIWRKAIPLFLQHVAELVLSTGKAVGLVRALKGPPLVNGFDNWRTWSVWKPMILTASSGKAPTFSLYLTICYYALSTKDSCPTVS